MGTLYESIKTLCDSAGIKPGKMCVDIGISKSTVTDLKSGRRDSVSLETAQKIADYFGVSVDRVLGSEQKEKSPPPEEAGLEYSDIQLLEAYKKADPITREAIQRILKLQ